MFATFFDTILYILLFAVDILGVVFLGFLIFAVIYNEKITRDAERASFESWKKLSARRNERNMD